MAQKLDYTLPFNDLTQYVPQNLRNPVIKGLIENLFNRQMTHDESVPLYGYIGRRPSSTDDRSIRVPQSTVERDVNAVIPALSFKLGTETIAFTVQDLINRAKVLGIDQTGMYWLYSQGNNYLPPIDIEKFANFYNYFWVAKTLPTPPDTPWNPELLPEYYVIQQPQPSDADKLNVVVATTTAVVRTGTGFEDQSFTVTFTGPNTFDLVATESLGAYSTSAVGAGPGQTAITNGYACVLDTPAVPNGSIGGGISYEQTFTFNVTGPSGTVNLMSFKVTRDPIYGSGGTWDDQEKFAIGDTFTIDTIFLSLNYNVTFSGTPGIKGKIGSVQSLSTYQTVDDVILQEGDRILVKDNNATQDGIYIVGPQSWKRAPDYSGVYITAGARVWAANGTVNTGMMFTSGAGNAWSVGTPSVSNTSDWQEGNFWVKSSDLEELGLTRSDVVQAVRPIIEYTSRLQLNAHVTNGIPTDSGGGSYKQEKTEFNQLPMFDLFRYDGTHAGLVSSVFFYVEDLTAELDLDLQKRVKLSSSDSADFIFNHGLADQFGDLLFYKTDGDLKSIWHAGYREATVVDQTFVGLKKGVITELIPTTDAVPQTWTLTAVSPLVFEAVGSIDGALPALINVGVLYDDSRFAVKIVAGEIPFVGGEQFVFSILAGPTLSPITFVGPLKGTLTGITPTAHTQQQVWTLTATSSTTFKVVGSKTSVLPAPFDIATVGVPYVSEDFTCLVVLGSQPFDIGDTFSFRIGNLEIPRYVYRDSDDGIFDLYGGEANDSASVGAYQVPRPFINNPYNESRDEVLEGTLYSHFRGILQNQFVQSSSDYAFGGSIKNWSEQQTLLASLLMQRDMTPISLIDLAQREYEVGLNTISDLFKTTIAQYFTSNGVVDYDGTVEQDARLDALLDSILAKRAGDHDSRTVLYDTTSGVVGIPATLPMLGVLPLSIPEIGFNNLLGRQLLKHHDGHSSTLFVDDIEFRRAVLNNYIDIEVLRADGTSTPAVGSFTQTEPVLPHRGELWIRPNGVEADMWSFDVDSDFGAPPSPVVGSSWYNRDTNVLHLWDGIQWVAQPSHSVRWRVVNLADTLNRVLLLVETRLYENTNPNTRIVDFTTSLLSDTNFNNQMERELFTFAANNGLNPLGSDFIGSSAITWNYSQASIANFPALNTATVPARWNNILKAHHATVPGVIHTIRPNLEPWFLVGFPSRTAWWTSLSGAQQSAYTPYATPEDLQTDETFVNAGYVRVAKTTLGVTFPSGLQTIDGEVLNSGDRVLLQNEVSPETNGIWVASSGVWTRANIQLNKNIYVAVLAGALNKGTVWALSADVPVVGTSSVLFKQVRYWSNQLWIDIQTAKPTLRLSVDTVRDALLPPYVSASTLTSANALTTVGTFSGRAEPFAYGELGPVEAIWTQSLEYGYSLARALFRHDPLMFLGFTWGFNWVEVDGILYDGYDVNTPGHKRFRLHGDTARTVDRSGNNPFVITSASGLSDVDVTIAFDAYEVDGVGRYQNFSVRNTSTGYVLGYMREGEASLPINAYDVSLSSILIEDYGQPFHVGDTFRVTANADGSNLTWSFVPAPKHRINGFGQIFSNALRELSIDTTDSYAVSAFREYDVNMSYRAGGLVATDDLKLFTDGDTLSTASYSLVFKKNEISKDLWIQSLRVTVASFGESVAKNNALAPKSDASDWVFLVEGYNPRYTKLSFYGLDTGGAFQTFNALDESATDTVWKQYTTKTSIVETYLPLEITGLQNLITFMFGYQEFLKENGWIFDTTDAPGSNIDALTGRSRNWQLEIERIVDTVYRGIQEGQGHVVNPFSDRLEVRQDMGLLSGFIDTSLFDITSHPGVYDIGGVRMAKDDLFLIRGNQSSSFSAAAPMYSAHAQLDEYEHLFIFNYFVEDSIGNGILYDPFSGARVITYKFNGRRQASQTMRPEFGGHYLVGDQVRQNLQSSTDNITNFYDANRVFENDLTTRHSLALLGFSTKEYFNNLDISNKSQFNFWRGLIQSKGTNLSIDAYLNNNRFDDAKVDEYWAYKIASYGDSRQNTYPELRLSVDDTVQQFTQLQFDAAPGDELQNFTQINRFDEERWFSLDDLDHDASFKAEIIGTYIRTSTEPNEEITLPFAADLLVGTGNYTQLNATTVIADALGSPIQIIGYGPATPRYNPVKLFNYVDAELIEEIPLWHPANGQHSPTALESINIISSLNPAKYNFSTQVANNNSYDPLRPWGSNEIGRVWLDTTNLAYIPYYDETIFPAREERLSRWGTLADYATIDVFEWVQSSVPPDEYNALAQEQAGDADLDPTTKAAGEVALQATYVRDRLWSIRPVAWSYAPVPDSDAHPSFSNSYDSILYTNIGTNTMSLESGLFSDYGIVAGMRIGAFDPNTDDPKPLSEALVTDEFSKEFVIGTAPFTAQSATVGAASFSVSVSMSEYTNVVGPLLFSDLAQDTESDIPLLDGDSVVVGYTYTSFLRTTQIDNGEESVIQIATATNVTMVTPSVTLVTGQVQTFTIPEFGLRISVTVTVGGTVDYNAFRDAIVDSLGSQVAVRDAVRVTDVVPISLAGLPLAEELSNNPDDLSPNGDIGWRAWSVPSQDELDADGRQPNSSWKPYSGDFVSITATLDQIQDAVAYEADPLTLNDGTVIERYETDWADWELLSKTTLTQTQLVTGPLVFTYTSNIDEDFASVYVNGIAKLRATYTIVGNTLTITSVPAGSIGTVIIRPYEPSSEELAFDPETEDDLTFQEQYKKDYEYVSLATRDQDGSPSTTLYYFWVKNKTIPAKSKKLSTSSIAQYLRDGPTNFLTFQHLIGTGIASDPYRYDALTISGLSYVVGKDDTFKLRFTRNFTLRDDPQQLDLKDTHTEWTLLRPGQRTKIPEALWMKLTDSLAGEDAAGNAIPALRRSLYDERNNSNTSYGFDREQALAPKDLLVSSVLYTIVNTKLINTSVPASQDGTYPSDFISFLDFDQSDSWFETPAATRQTMTDIWTNAKITQINEIFFAALNDILASNFELTDIFKTSRLSAYSIKVVAPGAVSAVYE